MAREKQDYWLDMHPQAWIDAKKRDTEGMIRLSYETRKELIIMLEYPGFTISDEISTFIDRLDSSVS